MGLNRSCWWCLWICPIHYLYLDNHNFLKQKKIKEKRIFLLLASNSRRKSPTQVFLTFLDLPWAVESWSNFFVGAEQGFNSQWRIHLLLIAGSLVDEFPGEELFDISQKSSHVQRRMKRATCRLANMTVEDCYERRVTCKRGCQFQDIRYDCRNHVYSRQYVLACKPYANDRGKCLLHIRNGKYGCQPCCANVNCGMHLPRCKNYEKWMKSSKNIINCQKLNV